MLRAGHVGAGWKGSGQWDRSDVWAVRIVWLLHPCAHGRAMSDETDDHGRGTCAGCVTADEHLVDTPRAKSWISRGPSSGEGPEMCTHAPVFQWRHRLVVSPSAALFSIFCTAAPILRRAGGLHSAAAIQWASRATWNAAFNVESAPNGTRMPGATTCSATCFMPGLLAAGRRVTGNDLRHGL